jgi:type VI secretion system protein ImpA
MPLRPDLLTPIPGDAPGGVDLRYDPVYDKIKEARREDDDLPQGEWVRTRKTADWAQVEKLTGEAIAIRSKDLQLAAWYTEALLRREGAAGLHAGLGLCADLLDTFWDGCFPEIDDGDVELRAAPLEWLGSAKFATIVKLVLPLNRAGHSLQAYQDGRRLGPEEAVANDSTKAAARQREIDAGKVPPEEFDARVAETPKAWYKALAAALAGITDALDRLDTIGRARFGDDAAPGYNALRDQLAEVAPVAAQLLAKKLETDPDPLEPEPAADGEASGTAPGVDGAPAPVGAAGAASALTAEIASADQAAAHATAAARWMRQQDPTSPAPYLLLRGLRWGELRAGRAVGARAGGGDGEIDPRLLVAPATAVRSQLKALALDGKWRELLEACEGVMGTPQGRGWLDLQRYALTACRELGEEYAPVADAIRGALGQLLRDRPALAGMTLMDDSPTANAETQQWLAQEFAPAAEPAPAPLAEAAAFAGVADTERPRGRSAFDRAMDEVRAGSPQRAIELLMRELAKERTPRGRFLRRIEIARIMVDAGLEAVALPMLEELQQLIETHQLEHWEAGELVAQPLTLLFRVYSAQGWDEGTTQPIYLRICRLDPLQAMAVKR